LTFLTATGELINFSASNLTANAGGGGVAIYPDGGFLARNIKIRNLTCGPNMTRAIAISSVAGHSNVLEDMTINGLYGRPRQWIEIGNGGDTMPVKSLVINNWYPDVGYAGNTINVNATSTVGKVTIRGGSLKMDLTGTGSNIIKLGASSIVLQAVFEDLSVDVRGVANSGRLCYGDRFHEIVVRNCHLTGPRFFGIWDADNNVIPPKITADAVRLGGTVDSINEGISALMQTARGYTLHMSNISTKGNNKLLNPFQGGVTQVVRARDMKMETTAIFTDAVVSIVKFSGDETAPVDITKIARVDGATAYNSNATANNGTDGVIPVGLYDCVGTAVGSWKRRGTVGGAGFQY
jgi:hypothetical protein